MNDLTRYKERQEELDTGDLLTYVSPGAIPWLIRKWSPNANHAGMVLHLPDYEGEKHRRWTLESTSGGPRMAFLSELLEQLNGECYWHQLKPEITKEQRNKAGCWALEQQGVVKYDFPGLLWFPIRRLSANIDKLLCSEYVQFSWAEGTIITMKAKDKIWKPSDLPIAGVTLPPVLLVEHKPFVQVSVKVDDVEVPGTMVVNP